MRVYAYPLDLTSQKNTRQFAQQEGYSVQQQPFSSDPPCIIVQGDSGSRGAGFDECFMELLALPVLNDSCRLYM